MKYLVYVGGSGGGTEVVALGGGGVREIVLVSGVRS